VSLTCCLYICLHINPGEEGVSNLLGGDKALDGHVHHWIEHLKRRGLDCAPTIEACAAELADDLCKLLQTSSGHVVCLDHTGWSAGDRPFEFLKSAAFGFGSDPPDEPSCTVEAGCTKCRSVRCTHASHQPPNPNDA
jgi:hypothetical protein